MTQLSDETIKKLNRLLSEMEVEEYGIRPQSETLQAIISLIEQEVVKARIDELRNRLRVQFIPSHWERLCGETNSWAKYVDRRIAELKLEAELWKG